MKGGVDRPGLGCRLRRLGVEGGGVSLGGRGQGGWSMQQPWRLLVYMEGGRRRLRGGTTRGREGRGVHVKGAERGASLLLRDLCMPFGALGGGATTWE